MQNIKSEEREPCGWSDIPDTWSDIPDTWSDI